MSVWQLTNIQKSYVKNTRLVLDNINLTVSKGERVGIIGASGVGKSTLAAVGLGLLPRDSGEIFLLGQSTRQWKKADWSKARKFVQILHQDPANSLDPFVTVSQFLNEAYRLHTQDQQVDHVQKTLRLLGIEHLSERKPAALSGGERRRVGIAKLMMSRPRLVIADELTAGLDSATTLETITALDAALPTDCAIVVISHDVQLVTRFTDRIYSMHNGQIIESFQSNHSPKHPTTVALFQAAGIS